MFKNHYAAGTGAVAIESAEETRLISTLLQELPSASVFVMTAPTGGIQQVQLIAGSTNFTTVKKDAIAVSGMAEAYAFIAKRAGQILVVKDWHTLCNSAGHWRALIEALPAIRSPGTEGNACLVVFVGPQFSFSADNPLRGRIPVLPFDTPNREALRAIANGAMTLPPGDEGQRLVDNLCGLAADVAEQVTAECLASNKGWNVATLGAARRRALQAGGLEIWQPVQEMGGLGGLKSFIEQEAVPWVNDPVLSVRRIACVGLPGCGKSFFSRWLAGKLGVECCRLSIPSLKGSLVGESEKALRRALRTVDNMSNDAPLVVVLDEIDKLATDGADGGTSAGMYSLLLTWAQETTSQAVVIATLNHMDKLDAALTSRFPVRFFFELPNEDERRSVIEQHYRRVGCPLDTVGLLASITDQYSSREIAEAIIPSIARLSNRNPTVPIVNMVVQRTTPVSVTQKDQIEAMRAAAKVLRKANDLDEYEVGTRRINV